MLLEELAQESLVRAHARRVESFSIRTVEPPAKRRTRRRRKRTRRGYGKSVITVTEVPK
jgi:hypothetical protein